MAKLAAPNVARNGAIVMVSLLLSRVLGLVRDSLISAYFGQGALTDAYTNSFAITDVLFFLIAGGALSSAFIPVFTELLATDREKEAWRVFRSVTTVMSIAITVLIVAAWVYAPQFVLWFAPKHIDDLGLTVLMSRIVLPAQFAFFVGGLLFGVLYAKGVFSVPGLGPNLYNLGIIVGAVLLSKFLNLGIVGLSWGALVGAFLGNLIVPAFVMRGMGASFVPLLDLKNEHVKKVFKLMLPVLLGLSLPAVYGLIIRKFANYYPGDGIVTALNQANTVMQAPLGIFGQSLGIAAFPALSEFFALGDMARFKGQLVRSLGLALYLSIPISAFFLIAGQEVVMVLYERGKFHHDATMRTTPALFWFSLGIMAWCLQPILLRAFFAIQQSVRPIVIGTATTVLFVGLCALVTKFNLPYYALGGAGSVAAVTLVAVLFVVLRQQIGSFDIPWVATTALLSTAASAGAGLLLYGMVLGIRAAHFEGRMAILITVPLAFCVFGWAYYYLTRLFKMPQTEYVDKALTRMGWFKPRAEA